MSAVLARIGGVIGDGAPDYTATSVHAAQLMGSWRSLATSDLAVKRQRSERFFVSWGLCAHVYRIASPTFDLFESDLALEAVPLARLMFEAALTAQWVAQVDGATEAFFNEQTRQRRIFLERLPSLGVAGLSGDELQQGIDALNEMDTLDTDASTSFEAICKDLAPGGEAAYTHYRLMCQLSHPSAYLIDHYLTESSDPPFLVRRARVSTASREAWAAIALSALVWAGTAVDYFETTHAMRPLLQAAETHVGIRRVLRPSHRALKR